MARCVAGSSRRRRRCRATTPSWPPRGILWTARQGGIHQETEVQAIMTFASALNFQPAAAGVLAADPVGGSMELSGVRRPLDREQRMNASGRMAA